MVENVIKIAIPSFTPGGLDAQINPRFGRCDYFTIVKMLENNIEEVTILQNPGVNAMGGAGPLAVQTIANENVNIVIGGDYGPNAAMALGQSGIKVYGYKNGNSSVKDILKDFQENALPQIEGANVGSHHGMSSGSGSGMGRGMGQGMGSGAGMGGGRGGRGGMGGGRGQGR